MLEYVWKELDSLLSGKFDEIEQNLQNTLMQILINLAMSQNMQNKFAIAQQNLDLAKNIFLTNFANKKTYQDYVIENQLNFEQGRIFFRQGKYTAAEIILQKVYQDSLKYNIDFYVVNAAQLLAMLGEETDQLARKEYWLKIAIAAATYSKDIKTKAMLEILQKM